MIDQPEATETPAEEKQDGSAEATNEDSTKEESQQQRAPLSNRRKWFYRVTLAYQKGLGLEESNNYWV